MMAIDTTDVLNKWNDVSDTVINEKPIFIKENSKQMMLSSIDFLESLLYGYNFTAKNYIEDDNSITLSLNEMDLVENASTEDDAKKLLAKAILEYSENFYNEFQKWSSAPNKKSEIPYVFKALALGDVEKIQITIIKNEPSVKNSKIKELLMKDSEFKKEYDKISQTIK